VTRVLSLILPAYAVVVLASWAGLQLLTDRFWPATLLAFGPRWALALPLPVLAAAVLFTHSKARFTALLAALGLIVFIPIMDLRLGLAPDVAADAIRVMTYNVGGTRMTTQMVDELLESERVQIATFQECNLQDAEITKRGWHFHKKYNQCAVSRYPILKAEARDPADMWALGGSGAVTRYEIDTPLGRIRLLNVHLETIRDGLDAVLALKWRGLPALAENRAQSALESRVGRTWSEEGDGALIVTGDFNLPVESAIYRENWGHLQNAFSTCGRGFGYTKLTGWFGIRIDHVLVSAALQCADAHVVRQQHGADHRPLIVDLVRHF